MARRTTQCYQQGVSLWWSEGHVARRPPRRCNCRQHSLQHKLLFNRAVFIEQRNILGHFLHMPWQAARAYSEPPMFEQGTWAEAWLRPAPPRGSLGDMLWALDRGVANITATLRRVGMWEDTLIIMFSDNGAGDTAWPTDDTPLRSQGHGMSSASAACLAFASM